MKQKEPEKNQNIIWYVYGCHGNCKYAFTNAQIRRSSASVISHSISRSDDAIYALSPNKLSPEIWLVYNHCLREGCQETRQRGRKEMKTALLYIRYDVSYLLEYNMDDFVKRLLKDNRIVNFEINRISTWGSPTHTF